MPEPISGPPLLPDSLGPLQFLAGVEIKEGEEIGIEGPQQLHRHTIEMQLLQRSINPSLSIFHRLPAGFAHLLPVVN